MGNEVDIILSSGLTLFGDKLIQYDKEWASQMEIYKSDGVTVQQRKCIAASKPTYCKSHAKNPLQHHSPAPQQRK